MRRLTKVAVAAATASVLAVAGCSSSGDSDGGAGKNLDGKGEITFAMGANDIGTVKPMIDEWNKQHPDQKVKVTELLKDADGAHDQLVKSLGAGNADYDVMALDVVWTAEFAAKGWIEPLQGQLAVDTSKLLKKPVASATYNGKLYAMPQNTNAQLLYYRTDLEPKAPANWSALTKSCEKAKERKVDCYVTQLKQYEGIVVNTAEFINGWGGTVVGSDGKAPTLNTPEAKAGLEAMVKAYKDGVIPKGAIGYTEEETAQQFLAGKAMYAQNWPYMIEKANTDDTSKVKGKFKVAPMVGQKGIGVSTLGGYNDAINVNSKNKGTAKAFLEFIAGQKVQDYFMKNSFSPVLASVYDAKDVQKEYPWASTLKKAIEAAQPRPVSPFYPAVSKAIQDNAYDAVLGKKSVDAALKDMTTAIESAGK